MIFEFGEDVCAPPLKGLTPLEKSYDVYEHYVEIISERTNALWLGFFHPSFYYRVYFQKRFLSTKRFKKSLYPQKINFVITNYYE